MNKTSYPGIDYSGPGSMINRDPETGIRYGIIHTGRVSMDALSAVYDNGTNVDYENYVADIKAILRRTMQEVRVLSDTGSADEEAVKSVLSDALSGILFSMRVKDVVDQIYDDLADLDRDDIDAACGLAFDVIVDDLGDNYQGTGDCTRMEWAEDGYELRIDGDGDLWVFKSPYFTYAQFCSPCAPGAGYLMRPMEGPSAANKCYCLGPDWFDEFTKCPYPVYSMETGKQI